MLGGWEARILREQKSGQAGLTLPRGLSNIREPLNDGPSEG